MASPASPFAFSEASGMGIVKPAAEIARWLAREDWGMHAGDAQGNSDHDMTLIQKIINSTGHF